METELIADYACEIGEGPLWHPAEKKVYWTDIPTGRMFRYDPASGRHEQFYEGEGVGGFTFQEDGGLLLFTTNGSVAVWRDGRVDRVVQKVPEGVASKFNDVAADPAGRVFCGTIGSDGKTGTLYRLELDGSLHPLVDGIATSNGIGFTLDHRQMYYTDSHAFKIYVFDYDVGTGAISNQRTFVETPSDGGLPDGMTVDSEGYVWSARWEGPAVFRYSPDGAEERRLEIPAAKVTSLAFGGDDFTDIYVTTAGGENKAKEGPGAGALHRANLGIKGVPEFFSRVGV